MRSRGISSTVSALLVTLVIVAALCLAYAASNNRLARSEKVAAEEALRAAVSAVEQAVVRAVAEGLNQTVDVGVDASFEIRGGVLYARYGGVEVSRALPRLGVPYLDSSASGGTVAVCVAPGGAVFLAPASRGGAGHGLRVVFEKGGYGNVAIEAGGSKATCRIDGNVVEKTRLPIALNSWGKATSPPGRPVYVTVASYAGRRALTVRPGGGAGEEYDFYAYYRQPLSGDIRIRGMVALGMPIWQPRGAEAYLYVLDAGDPSKVLKKYRIAAGGWGWRGFEVEVRGVEGEYLIAFGSRRAQGVPVVYLADLEVESSRPASLEIGDLVRVANRGSVAAKVRLRLVSGHGLEELQVALGGKVQVVVRDGMVASPLGGWVALEPGRSAPVSVKCVGGGDFSYRILVEALSEDGAEAGRLELVIRSP